MAKHVNDKVYIYTSTCGSSVGVSMLLRMKTFEKGTRYQNVHLLIYLSLIKCVWSSELCGHFAPRGSFLLQRQHILQIRASWSAAPFERECSSSVSFLFSESLRDAGFKITQAFYKFLALLNGTGRIAKLLCEWLLFL